MPETKKQELMARYELTESEAAIAEERQKVYGDPKINHDGIAQAWTALLEPHAKGLSEGKPLPAWTVALMMASLKLLRMRNVYHEDNYDDISVYLRFAKAWQQESEDDDLLGGTLNDQDIPASV